MVSDLIVSTFLFFLTMYGSIMGGSGVIKTSHTTTLNENLGLTNEEKKDDGTKK